MLFAGKRGSGREEGWLSTNIPNNLVEKCRKVWKIVEKYEKV